MKNKDHLTWGYFILLFSICPLILLLIQKLHKSSSYVYLSFFLANWVRWLHGIFEKYISLVIFIIAIVSNASSNVYLKMICLVSFTLSSSSVRQRYLLFHYSKWIRGCISYTFGRNFSVAFSKSIFCVEV